MNKSALTLLLLAFPLASAAHQLGLHRTQPGPSGGQASDALALPADLDARYVNDDQEKDAEITALRAEVRNLAREVEELKALIEQR